MKNNLIMSKVLCILASIVFKIKTKKKTHLLEVYLDFSIKCDMCRITY